MNTSIKDGRPAGRAVYASDDERWNAVIHRDPKADGQFFYSVQTTGVYCRPSCRSRLPRKENVEFHASLEAAERAGFRPCKRCQPAGPTLPQVYAARVATACRTIETAETLPSLDALARAAGMSRFHFHRVFTRIAGLTPKAYAAGHRADRVRRELAKRGTVTEALYEAGFNSSGRFYAESPRLLGMAPRSFLRGGTGETIRFEIRECSLGFILVAASAKGVCSISLGDDPACLSKELKIRFPEAQLVQGEKAFAGLVAKVVRLVEEPRVGLDLPLDVRGTAFQRRVWRALRQVPPGRTTSYGDLAKRIGIPRAVRAVAHACAANTLAVVIPCHRALRKSGELAGYRWGMQRKRILLDREQAQAERVPRPITRLPGPNRKGRGAILKVTGARSNAP